MLKKNGDAKIVETHLRQAVTMDPTFTPARLSLGKLFMRAQRWSVAVAELEQVVKLDVNVPEAYYQLGLAYGRLYERTADAQSAMATFKRLSDAAEEARGRGTTRSRQEIKQRAFLNLCATSVSSVSLWCFLAEQLTTEDTEVAQRE